MKRRAFLGVLSGAVTVGPKTLQAAAQTIGQDLPIAPSGLECLSSAAQNTSYPYSPSHISELDFLKKQLKELLIEKTQAEIEEEINERYVGGFDPDVVCLRSISLNAKYKRQKRICYLRSRRVEEKSLRERIAACIKGSLS